MTPMILAAAEGTGLISTVLSDVTTVFTQAVNMVTSNAIAAFFIGVPVIGAGIGLFHRLIRH